MPPATPTRKRLQRLVSSEVEPAPAKRLRFAAEDDDAKCTKPAPKPVPTEVMDTMPDQYPMVAREKECGTLDDFLQRSLGAGPRAPKASKPGVAPGGCLYVSGGPGTGKTCSVRAAVDAWKRQYPATEVIAVNCMGLSQRSPTGLLKRLGELAKGRAASSKAAPLPASGPGLVAAVAAQLSQLGPSVVVIADEVDQVLDKRPNHRAGGPDSLETLVSLTQVPGSAAIAFVAIANAVDLLERGAHAVLSKQRCEALLFQPYTAVQLKSILHARFAKAGEVGAAAAKALGPVGTELRVRQVASRSGDCRQVVCLCEQALFEAAVAANSEEQAQRATQPGATPGDSAQVATPQKLPAMQPKRTQNDPLAQVKQLPLEQQMLLCALVGSKGDAMRLQDICALYKDLCKRLHQPTNLACKDQVSSALSALEQRGLLSLRSVRRATATATIRGARGRAAVGARAPAGNVDTIAELSVPCKAVRESIRAANPLLEKCLD